MKTYSEKLKDPRWQRKRLEVMQRDNFKCTQCGDKSSTLNIHHWKYSTTPWESSNNDLSTVCEGCHKQIEKCKDITTAFLRQVDFRHGLLHMEKLLNKHGEIKTYFDDHVALFEGVTKKHKDNNLDDVMSAFDRLIESAPEE